MNTQSQIPSGAVPASNARPAEEAAQVLRPYGVGIDTHSKFIAVCILDNVGGAVRRVEREFDTSWASLLAAKQWIAEQLGPKAADPGGLHYCIESTGTYHLPVLRALGGVPCVVNPLLAGPTRRKTDVLDARLLAHHSITGLWPESFLPSDQAQQLRVLWAQRGEAVRATTRAGNRLNNMVLRFGHTFGADAPMRSLASQGIVEDLVAGRQAAARGVCPEGLPEAVRPTVGALLNQLRDGMVQTAAATRRAARFVKERSWPTGKGELPGGQLLDLLHTVPGVGETTALAWLSEVTDPRRFQNAGQVAAYCGCDPSLKVSAGKVTAQVRRKGNDRLHFALLHAAGPLVARRSEAFGLWGAAIAGRHKKGGYRKACGAVARRVATSLWIVHLKGEAFSYDGYFKREEAPLPKVPVEDMGLGRAAKLLKMTGLETSTEVCAAYLSGQLARLAGCGEKTLAAVRGWTEQARAQPREGTPAAKREVKRGPDGHGNYYLDPNTYFRPKAKTQQTKDPAGQAPAAERKGKTNGKDD